MELGASIPAASSRYEASERERTSAIIAETAELVTEITQELQS